MNKFHPFYVIGSVGMVITGIFHMFFSLALSLSVHAGFSSLYISFLVFMIIGLGLTLKREKLQKDLD